MDTEKIKQIEQETVTRYSQRFATLGESHRTLGWGSREQQVYRFDRVLDCVNLTNRVVLDVGCGFGDFLEYINKQNIPIRKYIGIDINSDFIDLASKKFPSAQFMNHSHFDLNSQQFCGDVTIMLGLLNFKQSVLDNWSYARKMIAQAFELTNEVLLVDFLSSWLTPDYPKEDFVYYYDPAQALNLALEMTPYVSLKHDYLPIPQQEFMLILWKQP
ncbi:MAG: class I SAM-dependent methyltransferase [Moorea sp. SIOASIH]|uniref:class I SAM-dependent methyltransferase n=1 Tax=Moorena sp. SIOASIH TaxID=2607817 RepID=UPI0013B6B8A2|nr:class I SAM-dependent methyltransferase [Moorena sp. SIOASIH]NEO35146.1 class I SAM-dependent methyltransferase [Moorena sp. SIOASIH]